MFGSLKLFNCPQVFSKDHVKSYKFFMDSNISHEQFFSIYRRRMSFPCSDFTQAHHIVTSEVFTVTHSQNQGFR